MSKMQSHGNPASDIVGYTTPQGKYTVRLYSCYHQVMHITEYGQN